MSIVAYRILLVIALIFAIAANLLEHHKNKNYSKYSSRIAWAIFCITLLLVFITVKYM